MGIAVLGLGTKIAKSDGGSPVGFATAIAEVGTITGPSTHADQIDVTTQDSTAREWLAGIQDAGSVSFSVNYAPANATHTALLTDLKDGSVDVYQLQFPDAASTKWQFSGIVTQADLEAPVDGPLKLNCEIKVTGDVNHSAS